MAIRGAGLVGFLEPGAVAANLLRVSRQSFYGASVVAVATVLVCGSWCRLALGADAAPIPPDEPSVGPSASSAPDRSPSPAAPTPARQAPTMASDRQEGFVLARPSVVQDGAILLVSVDAPQACDKAGGEWLGKPFRSWGAEQRWQALLPVPLGTKSELRLLFRCDATSVTFVIPVHEGNYPESQLTVDPKFTRPPPARAAVEQDEITRAYKQGSASLLWQQSFLRPTAGVETSSYGVRRTFNGKVASRHYGLDYDGKIGDPVLAANDGTVVLAGVDYYYTGNCVFIDHGNGLFTVYFHMSRLDVSNGQHVARGQQLGLIGATGRVTGAHLHFGVKLLGQYVNPTDLLHLLPLRVTAAQAAP